METSVISLPRLRCMIGLQVNYQGHACTVVEVLEREVELVLQVDKHQSIQLDQYGDAHRLGPNTITIPVLSSDRKQLHTTFLGLDLL